MGGVGAGGGGGGGGRRRIEAGQWGSGGVLGPRWSAVRVWRRRRPAARGTGHAWIFCGGDLVVGGVLRFAPSDGGGGLVGWGLLGLEAWRLEHVTQRLGCTCTPHSMVCGEDLRLPSNCTHCNSIGVCFGLIVNNIFQL